MNQIKLYLTLIMAVIRSQMQYRASFIMLSISQFIATFSDFIAILFIFGKFQNIKNWTLWEVGLLYGMTSVSFAISDMLCRGFDMFSRTIRFGDFDRILVRPAGVFLQVLSSDVDIRKLGRILQGLLVLVIAWYMLDIGLDPLKIIFLIISLISGLLFYIAIFVSGATICFWSIESTELPNMFTYGGVEATSYPITIYNRWFRNALIFVVPLAFVNYFPALFLLGKPDPLGFPYWVSFLSPLVSLMLMIFSLLFWNFGIRHYQSTGS